GIQYDYSRDLKGEDIQYISIPIVDVINEEYSLYLVDYVLERAGRRVFKMSDNGDLERNKIVIENIDKEKILKNTETLFHSDIILSVRDLLKDLHKSERRKMIGVDTLPLKDDRKEQKNLLNQVIMERSTTAIAGDLWALKGDAWMTKS